MFRVILITLLSGLLPVAAMTLDDALALAFEGNRSLLHARLQADTAALRLAIEGNEFRLSASPSLRAEQREAGERAEAGVEVRKTYPSGFEWQASAGAELDGEINGVARVRVSQALFRRAGDLVNLEGVRLADEGHRDARRRYFERKQELMLDVIAAYERVLRVERQHAADEAALGRLSRVFKLSQAREELGQGTRVESLRADLQRGEAEVRLQNSREQLGNAQDEFRRLLAKPLDWEFELEEVPLLELDAPQDGDAVALAMSNRLDLAIAMDAIRAADRQQKIASKMMQPDLRLVGDMQASGRNDWERDWFLGVSLNPDHDGQERELRLESAGTLLQRAELDEEELRVRIAQDVRVRIRDYHRSRTRFRIAGRNQDLAWKRVRLAEALFEIESGDPEAVTDAETAYADAVAAFLNARAEASLSAFRLMRSVGTLLDVPQELKP